MNVIQLYKKIKPIYGLDNDWDKIVLSFDILSDWLKCHRIIQKLRIIFNNFYAELNMEMKPLLTHPEGYIFFCNDYNDRLFISIEFFKWVKNTCSHNTQDSDTSEICSRAQLSFMTI